MELPGHVPTLAPGMTQVIEAGQAYTIKDDKGAEIELVGRERQWTMDFLRKFDLWMEAFDTLGPDNQITLRQARELKVAWDSMPSDLREQMPTYMQRGIKIR